MELLWLLCLYLEWLAQFYPWLFYSNQGFMIYFHHFWQRSLCLIRFSSFWLYFILDYQSCLIGKWITIFFKISFYSINNNTSAINCNHNSFKHEILFSFTMYNVCFITTTKPSLLPYKTHKSLHIKNSIEQEIGTEILLYIYFYCKNLKKHSKGLLWKYSLFDNTTNNMCQHWIKRLDNKSM